LGARDRESVAEVFPERDFQLGGGFGEAEKGIAAVTTEIAADAGAELAPGDVAADVVLRSVGVQRDFGRLSTINLSRTSGRSSVTKPVLRLTMRSNRARSAALRRLPP
jgi:hypothetical protein